MSLSDLENFVRDRITAWAPATDVSSGSPVDQKVIQPLLQRVGTDPFTVDAYTFMMARLGQEFPEMSIGNGDAVEDLLVKAALLLWDPLIREIQRIKAARSFNSPATLSVEEAEELGSTFFTPRETGEFAQGVGRIYFAQPQDLVVTAGNFFVSKANLVFYPSGRQSIRATEMSLNKEDDLYHFDVSVVAEQAGNQYNLEPNELSTVANVAAAVRVSNKVRFRGGSPAEDTESYIARLGRSITEKSMTSVRGIAATLGSAVPEITRLAVVGFSDPEMRRDIVSGGSLGAPVLVGVDGEVLTDGLFQPRSTRFRSAAVSFYDLAPRGPVRGYVLTVMGGLGPGAAPPIRDLEVVRIVSEHELEVADSVLFLGAQNVPFTVRRRELTLSGIPGGILRPDSPNGTVTIAPDELHVGGCFDLYSRGSASDPGKLKIDAVSDERPTFLGSAASVPLPGTGEPPVVQLNDLQLGTTYQLDDPTYRALRDARRSQYSLQILEGPIAGTYRILGVDLGTLGDYPLLTLDPTPLAVTPTLQFRWRLVTDIEFDLAEPKEVRLSGTDGAGAQNSNVFTTLTPVDLDALGVSAKDVLRLEGGPFEGDYQITEVITPGFNSVRLKERFPASFTGARFTIFRPNTDGGVQRPLLRVTSLKLLDTSGQPLGVEIPPALPVSARSNGFSNVGTGVKVRTDYAVLGIVSKEHIALGPNFGSSKLIRLVNDFGQVLDTHLAGHLTPSGIAAAFNAASIAHPGIGYSIAFAVESGAGTYRILITPFGPNTRTDPASDPAGLTTLFGNAEERHSRDIRDGDGTPIVWSSVSPGLDTELDVVSVREGNAAGLYGIAAITPASPPPFAPSTALRAKSELSPDFGRSVEVGSRSFGTARLYYLQPTSALLTPGTIFTGLNASGGTVRYLGDSTLKYQVLPPKPNGEKPLDGESSGTVFLSGSADFIRALVQEGDQLELDFVPILGGTSLADPVPSLALKDLNISLLEKGERTITFVNDVGTSGAVSRDGVASQINSQLGLEVCSVVEVTAGDFRLKFNPEILFKVRKGGNANSYLGLSTSADTSNASPHAGSYTVTGVTTSTLTVAGGFPAGTVTEGQYRVVRPGFQRITSSEMSANQAEAGLYYWDVELFSEGPGDAWNIAEGTELSFEGLIGDGYWLSTLDPNTSFSPIESVRMHLSRTLLPSGVDDSPVNTIQLSGQAMRVEYDYSTLTETIQDVATSDTERVVNASPLSRHLTPHYVRFDLEYVGGSRETEILPDIERLITNTLPEDPLESIELQAIVLAKGGTSIRNPIDLVAVVHQPDRKAVLARSQNAITTGRLAAFFPDRIKLSRKAR